MAATKFCALLVFLCLAGNLLYHRPQNSKDHSVLLGSQNQLTYGGSCALFSRPLAISTNMCSTGFCRSRMAVSKITKHGRITLLIPGHDPPLDITRFMDISINPGPMEEPTRQNKHSCDGDTDLHITSCTKTTIEYSRDCLYNIRRVPQCKPHPSLLDSLKSNGLLRYRGKRAGRHNVINFRNESSTNSSSLLYERQDGPRRHITIPSMLLTNVRSLMFKVDELQCVATTNCVDIVCVTETWFTDEIPDCAVQMDGYYILRKDRATYGGGVAIYVKNDTPCVRLPHLDLVDSSVTETMWVQLRPKRLPRAISCVLLGLVYHPPHATAEDNNNLYNHTQSVVDSFLLQHPDALICVAGDFNPNATRISSSRFTRMCGLTQIIKVLTRDTGTLDWLLTNSPKVFSNPRQLPKIGSSDHFCVLIQDCPKRSRPSKRTVVSRDTRESSLRSFGQWITSYDWNHVYRLESCEDKFDSFIATLCNAVDHFMPLQTRKAYSNDKPWITQKIKCWIKKRQKFFIRGGKDSLMFHIWRNKVQRAIRNCKKAFYKAKVMNLKDSAIGKWWKEVKSLSGVSHNERKWYSQLIDGVEVNSLDCLCGKINNFFVGLTADFPPLQPDDVDAIVADPPPESLLVSEYEAYVALRKIQVKKAPGPDGIPNVLLKTFAFELAPVISNIYNCSLREGFVPPLLKRAAVCPIPKRRPPKAVENDIRPISLTPQVAKIMEGFTLARCLPEILNKLDKHQFAVSGRSTEQALVYLLHLTLEVLDKGNSSIRYFFADFEKGFDLINHHILLAKLSTFDIHPIFLKWIAAFLQGRSQFVRIGNSVSSTKYLHGGIPQGTKLGPLLFAVMVNSLVSDWPLRIKFVDDLSVIEAVPRNSPSLINFIVRDIQEFAVQNDMKLNPSKCKEMVVDFLQYNSCVWRPITIGGTIIERVQSFKLLGVYISHDLTWDAHVDYVLKKANKRLYVLRNLKRSGVHVNDMVTIYCTLIRSVLEYASVVFSSLPNFLSKALEGVQKRALAIILPGIQYHVALLQTGLPTLLDRRAESCKRFMQKLDSSNPLYPLFRSRIVLNNQVYNLRSANIHKAMCNTERLKNFVSVKYLEYLS